MKKERRNKPSGAEAGANRRRALNRLLRDRRFVCALAGYVASCGILLYPFLQSVQPAAERAAGIQYRAPGGGDAADPGAAGQARSEAAVFAIPESFHEDLDSVFRTLIRLKEESGGRAADAPAREPALEGLSGAAAETLLSLEKEEIPHARLIAYRIVESVTEDGFFADDGGGTLERAVAFAAGEEGAGERYLDAVAELLTVRLRSGARLEGGAARGRRAREPVGAPRIGETGRVDEPAVEPGGRILGERRAAAAAAGGVPRKARWRGTAGLFVLVALVFGITGACLKTFSRRIYSDGKMVLIFVVLIVLSEALAVALATLVPSYFSGWLIGAPVGMLGLLTCFVLEPAAILIAAPLVSFMLVLALGLEFHHVLVGLAAGCASYVYASRARDKDAVIRAGLAVGGASMVTIGALSLLYADEVRQALADTFLYGGANGVVAYVFAAGIMPAMEKTFNILTPRRLLELSNPEEPLLKRLLVEAPGTYHHSISVGNLAECAADLLGADALLVRIASYYHDVGKLKRPYFFAENQMTPENHLAGTSPTLGALVISSHVRDGVEMAREHRLPPEIVRIIAEHHGTSLISFFYTEAKAEAEEGEEVSEERFRYPGPKPAALESAVVMLADSCEAAVRALRNPTPKEIEERVNAVVEARVIDRQFENCDITLNQISVTRECLIRTLSRMYHARIEYPELKEEAADKENQGAKAE
ncbi:MAG: HDIG domain-containing metalloprotein [bacterium]